MTTIFGQLGFQDTDRVFVSTAGQEAIYEAITAYVARANAELASSIRLFVSGTTENHTERIKTLDGGYLQETGNDVRPIPTKRAGQYDVAYPLQNFTAGIAIDDVTRAYMSAVEFERHIDNAIEKNANTVRRWMLRKLFNNVSDTWTDQLWGALTVKPLANGDTDEYPPVLGSINVATDDHYLVAGYLTNAISDSNNPLPTMRDEIEEHFGKTTGGNNIVALVNEAETPQLQELTNFTDVPDNFIRVGDNVDVPVGFPPIPSTARLVGRSDGTWIAEWAWIPATYMLAIHMVVEPPLRQRLDPADTGLGAGFQLVANMQDEWPVQKSYWRHRFGFGARSRLNGVMLQLKASGNYDIPSGYT